jgi:hypothetical protein
LLLKRRESVLIVDFISGKSLLAESVLEGQQRLDTNPAAGRATHTAASSKVPVIMVRHN